MLVLLLLLLLNISSLTLYSFCFSGYGIRCYNPGSFLLNHVDRTSTHVLSAIINVHQEGMLEDWPLEIYDHAGKMHRVSMEPGDIVLYESAKNTHGRPIPLNG